MNGLVELAGNPVTSPTLTSSIISLLAQLGRVFLCTCGNAIGAFISPFMKDIPRMVALCCVFFSVILLSCFVFCYSLLKGIQLVVPFYMEFASSTHQLGCCFGAGFLSQMYSHLLPDICPGIITDSRFIFGIHQQLLLKLIWNCFYYLRACVCVQHVTMPAVRFFTAATTAPAPSLLSSTITAPHQQNHWYYR